MPKKISKILTNEKIFVTSKEEILELRKKFKQLQKIYFKCSNCGKENQHRSLLGLKNNNYDFLCPKCLKEKHSLSKYGVRSPNQLENIKKKKEESYLKHYGVSNPNKSKKVRDKTKKTCLEKYGVDNPNKNKEIQNKKKSTCLRRYGVENPSQVQWVQEKKNKTTKNHYGVEHPLQNKNLREKAKQTTKEHYGVEFPVHSPFLRKKQYKKYKYNNEEFDSSWELAVWIWAQDNNIKIQREPVALQYEKDGKIHYYYPDFKIEEKLVEIKGDHFFDENNNLINPFNSELLEEKEACMSFYNVEIWKYENMLPILEYIYKKYGKDYIKKLINK